MGKKILFTTRVALPVTIIAAIVLYAYTSMCTWVTRDKFSGIENA